MGKLTFVFSIALILFFFVGFLVFTIKENKVLKEEKKKLEEESKIQKKQKSKEKEVTKEKEEKLEKIKTGDDTIRFDASVDVLSDISKKRKSKPSK